MEETPVKREKYYSAISRLLSSGKEYTARECAVELKKSGICVYGARQEVAPRLNEMCKFGAVEIVGSKIDELTRKKVSIYRKKELKWD